jgi:hypothetical protein
MAIMYVKAHVWLMVHILGSRYERREMVVGEGARGID